MSKYIGFVMIGVLVLPLVVGGFIAFPLDMLLAFGGTFLAFLWVYFAITLIEGKTFKEGARGLWVSWGGR